MTKGAVYSAPNCCEDLQSEVLATQCEVKNDDKQLDSALLRYILSGKEASRGQHDISFATDKAHGRGFGISNTAVALPNGLSWLAPPQVVFKSGVGG